MEAEYWGSIRLLADAEEPDATEQEIHEADAADSQMDRLCGLQETDPLQAALQRVWDAVQKGTITLLVLLSLAGFACADSINTVSLELKQDSVLPLLNDVSRDMAENLLAAQAAAPYTQWEPDSLQLSINSVLKAIGLEQSWGATFCDDSNCPIAWLQSTVAIDDGAAVTITPSSINFGEVPISTPEPITIVLLFVGWLWLWLVSLKRSAVR